MEESPEKELNEIEASNPSDIEFTIMVIRIFREISEDYKELSGNYSSMKRDIETVNWNQEKMKDTIYRMKKYIQGIKSRLDEAED